MYVGSNLLGRQKMQLEKNERERWLSEKNVYNKRSDRGIRG